MNAGRLSAWLGAMGLCACGLIDTSPRNPSTNFGGLRRVFMHDPAANDSLRAAATHQGVRFVLPPGKDCQLRVRSASSGDRLAWYLYRNGALEARPTLTAQNDSGEEVFALRSDQAGAAHFLARLFDPNGGSSPALPAHVRVLPVNPVESDSLSVRLFLVGGLAGLPDSSSKTGYAAAFLSELASIYSAFGIAVSGSYELVNPNGPPQALAFSATFVDLPGTRVPGAAHLYLVDSIYLQGAAPGSGMILGFSPREVVDMSADPGSRVILSVRTGNASKLATTAAHELGHFFGLRHPTGTSLDLQADDDQSNRDDGFASTPLCQGLTKPSAARAAQSPEELKESYCLFMAGVSCPLACDLTNLMFAYDCSGPGNAQHALTPEQRIFLRRNVGLLQGL